MSKLSFLALSTALSCQFLSAAHAAPLDALLSANKSTVPGKTEIEAGFDV